MVGEFMRGRSQLDQELLDVQKRLIEVGKDILYVFDPHREAHKPFGDADAFLYFFGHGSVRHHSRKRNQSFHPAETFGERAELDVI